ncbi:hypothetical protein ABD91_17685 [Lysinibacillus sphaericus]|uniref:TniQ family protein n=1 Tax=Lysinibacillus sphaericus TaxID=1421 RepID=UPI0018CE7A5A|nr:TniQ family protein [Lysinibacillus sphaericus]MBG9692621.1 hypothetical protein [Lysinibacillus sphaericus]
MERTIEIVVDSKKEIDEFLSYRSMFYNLEPIGIGTPYVESLSSYISRLATIHNLSISIFLKFAISPILKKDYIKNELGKGITKSTARYIHENSTICIDYVNALELLTGRKDILNLTMLNWSGIFPKDMSSRHRKWCPECLNQMQLESKIIYEPLIWYLADIEKCDIHKVQLQDKCPDCKRSLPFLHSKIQVGYCQYCNSWLGRKLVYSMNELSDEEEFILLNYKQLIREAPYLTTFPSNKFFSLYINKLKDKLGFKSNRKYANFIGYNPSTFSDWVNNKYTPSRKSLINVMSKLNHTLYEVIYVSDIKINVDIEKYNYKKKKDTPKKDIENKLIVEINAAKPKSIYEIARNSEFSPNTAQRHFPLLCKQIEENYRCYQGNLKIQKQNEVERVLKECLIGETPISLTQLTKENKLALRTVRRYAPDLCKKVSTRYKEYLAKLKIERLERILRDVRNAAIELHKNGLFPSKERIHKKLGRSVFLEDEIRLKWKDIVRDLGYKID